MRTTRKASRKSSALRLSASRRRILPALEVFEERLLMTTNGFLQGTVFVDTNNDGKLNTTETGQANALVSLYDSSNQLVAQQMTGSTGGYLFTDLAPGDYTLVETPPADYANAATQTMSPLQPILAGGTSSTIHVQVVDLTDYKAKVNVPTAGNPGALDNAKVGFYSETFNSGYGPLTTTITSPVAVPAFTSYCVDLVNGLNFGVNQFYTNGEPIPPGLNGAGNSGRIAYLYNHYGQGVDDNGTPLTRAQIYGLQLAFWELEYDSAANLGAGNFRVLNVVSPTTSSQYTADIAAANAFLTESLNKSETAIYLDAASNSHNTGGAGYQGILAAGSLNFANKPVSSISGTVFYDANNNGTKDSGEPGLATTVTLTGFDIDGNPVSLTTTSDATTGAYAFTNLAPSDSAGYTITETQPAGYLQGIDTPGSVGGTVAQSSTDDVVSTVVLGAAVDATDYNFGEILPVSISGMIYLDSNGNGLLDSGENGIGGGSVTLSGTTASGPIVPITIATNSDGTYSFSNLAPGTYTVTETVPTDYDATGSNVGTVNSAVDGNSISTTQLDTIVLTSGQDGIEYNFGVDQPVTISGVVYLDANTNGQLDSGEVGLNDVTVTLYDSNNNVVATTTTSGSGSDAGSYTFTDLVPGIYTVVETVPGGYNAIASNVGTVDNVLNGTSIDATQLGSVALTSGQDGYDYDFGLAQPQLGAITGTVYHDLTGNSFSPDDTIFSGVTLLLYADTNNSGTLDAGDGAPIATTTSASGTGFFEFDNLAPGTYFVSEVVPNGYILTGPTTKTYYVDMVPAGVTVPNNDFDNYQADCDLSEVKCVSFKVGTGWCAPTYSDLRGHTKQGDTVTVTFKYTGTTPDVFTLVSYTAPGSSFDANTASQQVIYQQDVQAVNGPGTYTLTVKIPNCYYQIDFVCGQAIDHFGPAGSNVFYTPQHRLISADNGGTRPCTDGGSCGTGSLSGFVYVDANNNGTKDQGETGIVGAKVTLTGVDSTGHAVSLTTTTGSGGSYQFTNLAPSNAAGYTITETQPSGYLDGKDSAGSLGGTVGADKVSAIVLSASAAGSNYNFGELRPGSLSGFVYTDGNTNANKDCNEQGIGGVTVTLTGTDDLGNSVTLTTTTSTDSCSPGAYTFSNLRPGTYVITESTPASYSHTGNSVGTVDGHTDGALDAALVDVIKSIVLPSGGTGINYNFGLKQTNKNVCSGDFATIGFWNSKNGQTLIKKLNGSSYSTALGNWLAQQFPNLYGSRCGGDNLAGKTNAQVASYFQSLFCTWGPKAGAQVLATALAVYATSSQLSGGTYAAAYGFNVTADGVGSATYNVGRYGDVFGVPDYSTITVLELLKATDSISSRGDICHNNWWDMCAVNDLFSDINECGDIC